jgi:hypothetical protein
LALAFKISSQAKDVMKPSSWPGLAWLIASGRARHSPNLDRKIVMKDEDFFHNGHENE